MSLSERKIKNLEAFGNWVGSPAAALTTTIWNILMIRKCRIRSKRSSVHRDTLYILSCINQYQYPRRPKTDGNDHRRDVALLRGILYPYVQDSEKLPDTLRNKLECLSTHLAFQLRLQRRKGVYPLWLNIIWFLLSFVFSIVTAFASLGDNTTAHSLALGLLLSWMPTLVLATIIDRNPASETRCGILIQRWLYTVDALFAAEALGMGNIPGIHASSTDELTVDDCGDEDISLLSIRDPGNVYPARRQDTEQRVASDSIVNTRQWHKCAEMRDFYVGDFVGQGRRMRYCAVADTVLDLKLDRKTPRSIDLPGDSEAVHFREALPNRPQEWYLVWLVSQFLVGAGYATAFVVSFKTPTIGLGCRTLSYTTWYLLSFFSWLFLGIWQEPPKYTIGGLNNCRCKSSTFGSSGYGGYMDFENGEFYHQAYAVQEVWALATTFGLLIAGCAILYFGRRWSRDSDLWRVDEAFEPPVVEGVDLLWLI
ncbi:hypothetical protein LTR05_000351 [Lithohypha guttulata]|uniref:Uncharacterized protein n=1 Tax=Lithohypha guttulata TaxID=1690604 RepID=A0AAN7YK97_9EURO|nr:hypothetical protein LTR05_000351 [Lithohypha guttulata]